MIQELKNMYVIINPDGKTIDYTTISCMRKWCLGIFLKDSAMTWKMCYKLGYRCMKVDIKISKPFYY